MGTHCQVDGAYRWELSLTPETVVALLSAVCVDRNDPNSQFLGHLLWGPKSWRIRFEGYSFELWQFTSGNWNYIAGLPRGTIVPTNIGSRVELRPDTTAGTAQFRSLSKGISIVIPLVAGAGFFLALPDSVSLWIRIAGTLACTAWLAFGFRRLAPWMAKKSYTDFLDELFDEHLLPAANSGEKTIYHAVPPCQGK